MNDLIQARLKRPSTLQQPADATPEVRHEAALHASATNTLPIAVSGDPRASRQDPRFLDGAQQSAADADADADADAAAAVFMSPTPRRAVPEPVPTTPTQSLVAAVDANQPQPPHTPTVVVSLMSQPEPVGAPLTRSALDERRSVVPTSSSASSHDRPLDATANSSSTTSHARQSPSPRQVTPVSGARRTSAPGTGGSTDRRSGRPRRTQTHARGSPPMPRSAETTVSRRGQRSGLVEFASVPVVDPASAVIQRPVRVQGRGRSARRRRRVQRQRQQREAKHSHASGGWCACCDAESPDQQS